MATVIGRYVITLQKTHFSLNSGCATGQKVIKSN